MRPTYHHAARERNARFEKARSGDDARQWYKTDFWSKLRAAQLAKEHLCRFHARQGARVKATRVDHVRPHRGNKALFFDPRNLQSLCEHCHNATKQAIEHSRYHRIGPDGWPLEEPCRE